MKKININEYKKITKYPNFIGAAAFTGLTAVQTVLFVIWVCKNFSVKGIAGTALMGAAIFAFIKILVDKVIKKEGKLIPYMIVATLYIVTLPIVASVNFHASMIGLCATLLLLSVIFSILYFYGEHNRRLRVLVCMFADLCLLGYLNRPAFWAGVGEALIFLLIQLIRNLKTKKANISDKSWRNTLLLFLILVIIMLLPQYFRFNEMKVVRYEKTASEQLAARFIVPYFMMDQYDTNERYLLGVIKENEYDANHSYSEFNRLMARYEADGLDMEEIWRNLYKNTYYKYGKDAAKQFVKDMIDNTFGPFRIMSNMKDESRKTHHGYYYGLFENESPILSDRYMNFGLSGLFVVTLALLLQAIGLCIIDLVTGKFKIKLEEGRHRRIEAIILVIAAGILWVVCQTLFSLAGASYVVGIYATITWILIAPFVWFQKE